MRLGVRWLGPGRELYVIGAAYAQPVDGAQVVVDLRHGVPRDDELLGLINTLIEARLEALPWVVTGGDGWQTELLRAQIDGVLDTFGLRPFIEELPIPPVLVGLGDALVAGGAYHPWSDGLTRLVIRAVTDGSTEAAAVVADALLEEGDAVAAALADEQARGWTPVAVRGLAYPLSPPCWPASAPGVAAGPGPSLPSSLRRALEGGALQEPKDGARVLALARRAAEVDGERLFGFALDLRGGCDPS